MLTLFYDVFGLLVMPERKIINVVLQTILNLELMDETLKRRNNAAFPAKTRLLTFCLESARSARIGLVSLRSSSNIRYKLLRVCARVCACMCMSVDACMNGCNSAVSTVLS